MAGSPGRSKSLVSRLTNSAAMCWQSAALPPLPQMSSLPPARKASVMTPAAVAIASAQASAVRRLIAALSARYDRTVAVD